MAVINKSDSKQCNNSERYCLLLLLNLNITNQSGRLLNNLSSCQDHHKTFMVFRIHRQHFKRLLSFTNLSIFFFFLFLVHIYDRMIPTLSVIDCIFNMKLLHSLAWICFHFNLMGNGNRKKEGKNDDVSIQE